MNLAGYISAHLFTVEMFKAEQLLKVIYNHITFKKIFKLQELTVSGYISTEIVQVCLLVSNRIVGLI